MTETLPGADISGYYAALGIQLPPGRKPKPPLDASSIPTHIGEATAIRHAASTLNTGPGTATAAARKAERSTPRPRRATVTGPRST